MSGSFSSRAPSSRVRRDVGSDVVVAQGTEAGGHGATRSTLALVPAVVDAVRECNDDVVVVAAGGITDGRGLAAALALGAQGVLVGTRFFAAHESLGPRQPRPKSLQQAVTIRSAHVSSTSSGDWIGSHHIPVAHCRTPFPGGGTGARRTSRIPFPPK
jgi:nitronate monooxygenase